ncbi:drug/metabolite transporter (DMT)-like permease [Actinokineospora baliensis]|uniref:DMT family transporter n=1 Tax=Actinokineospora baliensis TaxID=547056 RepID=UPI001EF96196|nr:DMT family transporter [Actinokineospora baliensis]MBM7773494.1 drug/metabolite transporter (DMT)-like permease [Actinokineospora baliensis]
MDSMSRAGNSATRVLVAYVALALTWGSSFFFIKIAVAGLTPQQLVLGRLVLGAVTLNLILLLTGRRWPRDPRLIGHLAVVAFLLCVLPLLLFAWAGRHIPSGLSSIYNATTPLMTMAIGLALLPAERLTALRSLGILIGAVGIVVVLAPWALLADLGELSGTGLPQLACLVGTASYGLAFTHLRKHVSGRHQHDAATIAAVQVALAAAMMLLVAPFTAVTPVSLTTPIVLSVVVLGVLASGIAYIWNTFIVEHWGATPASTVTYVSPLVGVALGIAVLGEDITWNQPVGALVVVFGILLSQGLLSRRAEHAEQLARK